MSCKSLLVIGVLTFVTLGAAAIAPLLALAAVPTPAAAAAATARLLAVAAVPTPAAAAAPLPAVPVVPTPPVVAAPVPTLVLAPASRAAADDLPADAQEEIDQFRREAARIREDAEAKVAAKKADLVKRLRTLQTKYTQEDKLDEAVAIRDCVRLLEGGFAVGQKAQVTDGIRCVARPAVTSRTCPKVEVEWGGTWWAAEVLQVRGNQYYIHYTGWSDSWNEWVSECRIRLCGPCGTCYRR